MQKAIPIPIMGGMIYVVFVMVMVFHAALKLKGG